MPSQSRTLLIAAALAAATGAVAAQEAPMQSEPSDPYLWLEDVTGERALAWVREQNARTEAELASTPAFKTLEADIRAILDSDEKIPA
ncbi:hypothetical protein, partial [Salmonella sp. s55884]|uniref:hypothetical protein n=1 Tax=Salmonella sp. s55884 TaxID=3159683 RepID=UPI0039804C1F